MNLVFTGHPDPQPVPVSQRTSAQAQGDVRLTIHKGVGQELVRRHKESDEFSAARKDLLSLLGECSVRIWTVRIALY